VIVPIMTYERSTLLNSEKEAMPNSEQGETAPRLTVDAFQLSLGVKHNDIAIVGRVYVAV